MKNEKGKASPISEQQSGTWGFSGISTTTEKLYRDPENFKQSMIFMEENFLLENKTSFSKVSFTSQTSFFFLPKSFL